MKPHPVELMNYFFPEQNVRANPRHDPEKDTVMVSKVHHNLTRLPIEGETRYACDLTLELDEEESENPSYFYSIQAYGIFAITDHDFDEQNADHQVLLTATQILTGVTRERVAEVTSRGPWGPVLIRIGSIGVDALPGEKAIAENQANT